MGSSASVLSLPLIIITCNEVTTTNRSQLMFFFPPLFFQAFYQADYSHWPVSVKKVNNLVPLDFMNRNRNANSNECYGNNVIKWTKSRNSSDVDVQKKLGMGLFGASWVGSRGFFFGSMEDGLWLEYHRWVNVDQLTEPNPTAHNIKAGAGYGYAGPCTKGSALVVINLALSFLLKLTYDWLFFFPLLFV